MCFVCDCGTHWKSGLVRISRKTVSHVIHVKNRKHVSSFYLVIILSEIYNKGRIREEQRYRLMNKDAFILTASSIIKKYLK